MITQKVFVEGLGEVAYSDGVLVDNVRDLKGRFISPRNEAFVRFHTKEKESIGKRDGTRVALEVDYARKEPPVLFRYDKLSPLLAKRVVDANSQLKYFCTDSTRRYETKRKLADREEKQGKSPQERTAIALPRDFFGMTLTENRQYLDFILQDLAGQYFELNGNIPINFYPIDKQVVDADNSNLLTNPNGTIIVPYLWFRNLDPRFELNGDSRYANYYLRARGVLESAEGSAKIFSEERQKLYYTPKEFNR